MNFYPFIDNSGHCFPDFIVMFLYILYSADYSFYGTTAGHPYRPLFYYTHTTIAFLAQTVAGNNLYCINTREAALHEF